MRSLIAYVVWSVVLVACSSPQPPGTLDNPTDDAGKKPITTKPVLSKDKDASGPAVVLKKCSDLHCGDNASCDDSGSGDAMCRCDQGYAGDGMSCTDIDECQTDNGGCGTDGHCVNMPGSFRCGCGTGTDTQDVCPKNAVCVNDKGNSHCACGGDFTGDDPNNCYCNLEGYWAMRQDVAICWHARTLMNVTYVASGVAQLSVWELDRYHYDGTTLKVETIGCGEDQDPDLISPYFMETYSSYLPQETIDRLGFQNGGDVTAPGLVPGNMFTANDQVATTGIDLGPDPLHADWPKSGKDVNPIGGAPPAWVDTDGDGEPGLTVWPKVPSDSTGPCADKRSCYPHYSYLPATLSDTGTNTIDKRAGCVSVGTRAINRFTADLDSCTHMSGEIINLKSEGRFEGCTLVPKPKWQQDISCDQADWDTATKASDINKQVTRCTTDDVHLLDDQDQSQNNKVTYVLQKLSSLDAKTMPTCSDVKAALPAIERSGPTTICPF